LIRNSEKSTFAIAGSFYAFSARSAGGRGGLLLAWLLDWKYDGRELAMLYYDRVFELVVITILIVVMMIANMFLLRGDRSIKR
jgi:hypothetical protein